jgi:hypothetical protein
MRIKPIASLLIILALSFIITGVIRYMDNINDDKWPTPEEQLINWYTPMVDYINERYEDDTFEFIRRDTWSNDSIFVSSEKFPDEQIRIAHVTSDGRNYFNDNYLSFKYRERTTATIAEILDEVIEHDFKLFYEPTNSIGVHVFPANGSFDDYIINENSRLRFVAMVKPGYDISNMDNIAEKLKESFVCRNVLVFNAAVLFCQDYDVYESIDKSNFREFNKEPGISIHYYWNTQSMEFKW